MLDFSIASDHDQRFLCESERTGPQLRAFFEAFAFWILVVCQRRSSYTQNDHLNNILINSNLLSTTQTSALVFANQQHVCPHPLPLPRGSLPAVAPPTDCLVSEQCCSSFCWFVLGCEREDAPGRVRLGVGLARRGDRGEHLGPHCLALGGRESPHALR